jgi:hypothetical protein
VPAATTIAQVLARTGTVSPYMVNVLKAALLAITAQIAPPHAVRNVETKAAINLTVTVTTAKTLTDQVTYALDVQLVTTVTTANINVLKAALESLIRANSLTVRADPVMLVTTVHHAKSHVMTLARTPATVRPEHAPTSVSCGIRTQRLMSRRTT